MGYKKFSGGKFFKFDEEGKTLEGKWGGARPGKPFKGQPTMNGSIIDEEGERHVFGLTAALADMEYIPVGTQVRVVFTGWDKTQDGTRYKGFDIDVDEDMVMIQPAQKEVEKKIEEDQVPF